MVPCPPVLLGGVFLQLAIMDPVSLPGCLDSCGHLHDDCEEGFSPGLQAGWTKPDLLAQTATFPCFQTMDIIKTMLEGMERPEVLLRSPVAFLMAKPESYRKRDKNRGKQDFTF